MISFLSVLVLAAAVLIMFATFGKSFTSSTAMNPFKLGFGISRSVAITTSATTKRHLSVCMSGGVKQMSVQDFGAILKGDKRKVLPCLLVYILSIDIHELRQRILKSYSSLSLYLNISSVLSDH